MDRPLDRLAAALLEAPGSALLHGVPGRRRIRLATRPPSEVVLLEAPETPAGLPELEDHVAAAVAGARFRRSRHIVVVNPAGLEVAPLVKRQVLPGPLDARPIGAWDWVPGRPPVHLRGQQLEEVALAAAAAEAGSGLSFEASQATSREAAREAQALVESQRRRLPVVTLGILATCFAVYGLEVLWGQGEPVLVVGRMGAEIPAAVARGDWWRLFAAILLHASFAHVFWNSLGLFVLGSFLERLIGGARFLIVFVGSALFGGLLSHTRVSGILGLGASGGVWGVMVAGAVAVTVPRDLLPEPLAVRLRRRAWWMVAVGLMYSVGDLLRPSVDVVAHLAGGLAGGVLVVLLTRSPSHYRLPEPSWAVRVGAVALGGLLVGSLVLAIARGRPWAPEEPWRLERVAIGESGLSIEVPAGFPMTADPVLRRWAWGDVNADGARLVVYLPGPPPSWSDPGDPLIRAARIGLEERDDHLDYSIDPRPERLPSGRETVFAELWSRRTPWRWVWIWRSGPEDDPVMVVAEVLGLTPAVRRDQIRRIADSLSPEPVTATPE